MSPEKNSAMRDVPAAIIAFIVAASCVASLTPGIGTDLDYFIGWVIFIGCLALTMRCGPKAWNGIAAACIGVTFNPFARLYFSTIQPFVNILAAIAAGTAGCMLIMRRH